MSLWCWLNGASRLSAEILFPASIGKNGVKNILCLRFLSLAQDYHQNWALSLLGQKSGHRAWLKRR